jgi:hypothetical protein
MDAVAQEIAALRQEIAALRQDLGAMLAPAETLSVIEKARIIREAHASGDRRKIRAANRRINGGQI